MGSSVSGFFAGAALVGVCMLLFQVGELRRRLSRLEGKLDLLLNERDLQYDPFSEVPDDVADAIRSGDRVRAIELYREATGHDLTRATETVGELSMQCHVKPSGETGKLFATVTAGAISGAVSGAILAAAFWPPHLADALSFRATMIGGIVGSFVGILVGVAVYKVVRKRDRKEV